jgi:hypothetical protein
MPHGIAGHDEQPRGVRIGEQHGETGTALEYPGQRVEVGLIGDIQPMLGDRGGEYDRLEEVGARAREDRQSVYRRIDLADVGADLLGIASEALALGSLGVEDAKAFTKFPAEERLEIVSPVIVGPHVEVEADDGIGAALEGGQLVELREELIGKRHTFGCRNRYAASHHRQPARLKSEPCNLSVSGPAPLR